MNSFLMRTVILLAFLLVARPLRAHYLWITIRSNADRESVANIIFEEGPKPGDGHYLEHFLGTSDVWIRTLEQPTPSPQKAKEVRQDDKRWMQLSVSDEPPYSVDAYGKFGVYAYGDTKMLLHYYARYLKAEAHDAMHEVGHAEQLKLDLIPHDIGDDIEFKLVWDGSPVADRMVFIRGSNGFRENIRTDSAGMIRIKRPADGQLRLRSSVEFATPGQDQGDAYERVRHNITLIIPETKDESRLSP
ncbi:MAG: hypothetical protein AAF745_05295 [Planctomycetota bacterium]